MGSLWGVEQAAEHLGVSPRHVRSLIASERLPAQRLGSVWLLDPEAVRVRAREGAQAGRPFSPVLAWQALHVMDAMCVADDPRSPAAGVWDAIADRRVRHRLRQALADPRPSARWRHALGGRAKRLPVWAHPGVMARMASDERLRLGGSAAAAAHAIDAADPQARRWYIDADDLDVVLGEYRLKRDNSSELDLMVIPDVVPVELRPATGQPVPLAVALVDLLESPDARERHAAAQQLEPLHLSGAP